MFLPLRLHLCDNILSPGRRGAEAAPPNGNRAELRTQARMAAGGGGAPRAPPDPPPLPVDRPVPTGVATGAIPRIRRNFEAVPQFPALDIEQPPQNEDGQMPYVQQPMALVKAKS